jgi:hypothetical protein
MTKKRKKKRTSVRDRLIINNRKEAEVGRSRKQFSIATKYSIRRQNGQMHRH